MSYDSHKSLSAGCLSEHRSPCTLPPSLCVRTKTTELCSLQHRNRPESCYRTLLTNCLVPCAEHFGAFHWIKCVTAGKHLGIVEKCSGETLL